MRRYEDLTDVDDFEEAEKITQQIYSTQDVKISEVFALVVKGQGQMKKISPLVQKFQEFWSEICQELGENKEFQKKCKIAVASVSRDIESRFPSFEYQVKESPQQYRIDALSVLIDMMNPAKSQKKCQPANDRFADEEQKNSGDSQEQAAKQKISEYELEAETTIEMWQEFKEEFKDFLRNQGIGMIDSTLQN